MEQYLHLLIARADEYVPKPQQIRSFFEKLIEQKVVPNIESMSVSTLSDKVRSGINPFTGETVTFPIPNVTKLKHLSEFDSAAENLIDFAFFIDGVGRPSIPPIAVDFTDPYCLSVACYVKSVPYNTSAADPEQSSTVSLQFNRPSLHPVPFGYFTDPNTGTTIKVADAGRARFWIEFELGKWLFPTVENGDLEILNPTILDWAQRDFGVSFAQGCHYF